MYAAFLETNLYQYLVMASTETGLINELVMDIESDYEDYVILQLHAGHNNSFDEELEEKLRTMIYTLKTEKENACKL